MWKENFYLLWLIIGIGDVFSMFLEKIFVRKGEGYFNIVMGFMNVKMIFVFIRRFSVNLIK